MILRIPQLHMGQKISPKSGLFCVTNADRFYGFLPACSLDMLMN